MYHHQTWQVDSTLQVLVIHCFFWGCLDSFVDSGSFSRILYHYKQPLSVQDHVLGPLAAYDMNSHVRD